MIPNITLLQIKSQMTHDHSGRVYSGLNWNHAKWTWPSKPFSTLKITFNRRTKQGQINTKHFSQASFPPLCFSETFVREMGLYRSSWILTLCDRRTKVRKDTDRGNGRVHLIEEASRLCSQPRKDASCMNNSNLKSIQCRQFLLECRSLKDRNTPVCLNLPLCKKQAPVPAKLTYSIDAFRGLFNLSKPVWKKVTGHGHTIQSEKWK